MDTNSDSTCPPDLPAAHPGSTEDSSQLLDVAHDTMCPPDQIQVNPGICIETGWSRHVMHGSAGAGGTSDIGECRKDNQGTRTEGE